MANLELNISNVAGLSAEFFEGGDTCFGVELTVKQYEDKRVKEPIALCLFFTNRETAKAYANAISVAEFATTTRRSDAGHQSETDQGG